MCVRRHFNTARWAKQTSTSHSVPAHTMGASHYWRGVRL
jgi:hypothetical protein